MRPTPSRRAPDSVLAKLERLRVSGNIALRYEEQLDRDEYLAMSKVLEALGGKWNRKAKGHVFPGDPAPLLQHVLETGVYTDGKRDFGFFETPSDLARAMVLRAGARRGNRVLEPSAGRGRIATAARAEGLDVTCVELQREHARHLTALGFRTVEADFLSVRLSIQAPCDSAIEYVLDDPPFDAVLMNPPFAGQADIDHVLHALGMLRMGGRLVAIMSGGVAFRENRKTQDFRSRLDSIEPLPDGTFAEAGTQVRTVLVTMTRTASTQHLPLAGA